MRDRFFETLSAAQPFTAAIRDGFTLAEIKRDLIAILDPYIKDKELLQWAAVGPLAGEAICVGKLSTCSEWQEILELVVRTRTRALDVNRGGSIEVMTLCQDQLIEAQRSFALQVIFEIPKSDLKLDEFAYEIFRNIGSVLETALQPFLKELYCLVLLIEGEPVDVPAVFGEDFGAVISKLADRSPYENLVAPNPLGLRLNQWRNIAQHHSYSIVEGVIVATYGQRVLHEIHLSRESLLSAATEIGMRLGALRCSRVLVLINSGEEICRMLPERIADPYAEATTLAASFATQGFELTSLIDEAGQVSAKFVDVMPSMDPIRAIHCSQFVIPIAVRFPQRTVRVELSSGRSVWVFEIPSSKMTDLLKLNNPLDGLADAIDWANACKPL